MASVELRCKTCGKTWLETEDLLVCRFCSSSDIIVEDKDFRTDHMTGNERIEDDTLEDPTWSRQ